MTFTLMSSEAIQIVENPANFPTVLTTSSALLSSVRQFKATDVCANMESINNPILRKKLSVPEDSYLRLCIRLSGKSWIEAMESGAELWLSSIKESEFSKITGPDSPWSQEAYLGRFQEIGPAEIKKASVNGKYVNRSAKLAEHRFLELALDETRKGRLHLPSGEACTLEMTSYNRHAIDFDLQCGQEKESFLGYLFDTAMWKTR